MPNHLIKIIAPFNCNFNLTEDYNRIKQYVQKISLKIQKL